MKITFKHRSNLYLN